MSLGHNQPKQHHLYIFDLDDTLYLWKLGPAARAAYEAKLRPYLERLSHEGATLAVASFNRNACKLLTSMGIRPLFSQVICPQELRTGPRVADPGLEFDNEDKASMVLRVCNSFPDIPRENVQFFDDDIDSVEAAGTGVWALKACTTTKSKGNARRTWDRKWDHNNAEIATRERMYEPAHAYYRGGDPLTAQGRLEDGPGMLA
ncbi:hypothetical protein HDU90_007606 [Geranomyces variabilis]|nr:hypothetical protein HDU90_007606 [Geranomyces variabilis]